MIGDTIEAAAALGPWPGPEPPVDAPGRILPCFGIADFLKLDVPPRRALLVAADGSQPVLREKDLVIAGAPRGTGKSFFVATIAVALATGGSAFRWRAARPASVLWVDGELPASTLQQRIAQLLDRDADLDAVQLRIVARDLCDRGLPSLATNEGQKLLAPHLEGADVLLLDSIATLCGTSEENSSSEWAPMQDWLLELRARGITTILVHHTGRNGQLRGTSGREDVLDTIWSLRRPSDYTAETGCEFEVHWTKARGAHGKTVEPFSARLSVGGDGRAAWALSSVAGHDHEIAMGMYRDGARAGDVVAELGCSRRSAFRWQAEAKAEGILSGGGRR